MAIPAAELTQPPTQFSGKTLWQVLACAAFLLIALKPCNGEEIYRWVDGAGKTHFSDTPPSLDGYAPLKAPSSAPSALKSSNIPENHYSVINQAKRLEIDRQKHDKARAESKTKHSRADGTGRRHRHESAHYGHDRGYDGWESFSNLGPRTDLTRFSRGHPVYSPTLGFPSNHRGKGHRGRMSHPETPRNGRSRRGAVQFGR